jgi:S-formylglutathione hydrolase FrmB
MHRAPVRSTIRLALTALLLLLRPAPGAAAALAPFADSHGIHVESFQQVDARQLAIRVSTAALQHPVDVRVLLPAGYMDGPGRRYPVLYLFHGTSGRSSDWIVTGNAVQTTADVPLIVVLPDAGFNGDGGGWFADWFNGGAGGPPMWETFHVAQVVPWIDDNLRTVARRAGRAVAGLSQGGFGALSYAARHPDLFTSVASFSGGCVIDRDPQAIDVSTAIIQYTTGTLSGADPDAVFGPRATQELNWQAHDPGTLVENLRGMDVELWTGNGSPGPLDPPGSGPSAIEVITYGATQLFDGFLTDAGIPHAYTDYGPGTHSFPYWARDLAEYVPPLMQRFRHPTAPPAAIDYLSADARWRHWGWDVAVTRAVPGFTQLAGARRRGFMLTGTGLAKVRTPRFYPPGAQVRVTTTGPDGHASRRATIGASGRLRIAVPLGDGPVPTTTRVHIRRIARGGAVASVVGGAAFRAA